MGKVQFASICICKRTVLRVFLHAGPISTVRAGMDGVRDFCPPVNFSWVALLRDLHLRSLLSSYEDGRGSALPARDEETESFKTSIPKAERWQ